MIVLFFLFFGVNSAYIHAHVGTYLLGRPSGLFRVNVTVIVINTEN